jgi:hypothetical protein
MSEAHLPLFYSLLVDLAFWICLLVLSLPWRNYRRLHGTQIDS